MMFNYFELYSLHFTVSGDHLRIMYAHNFSEKVWLRTLSLEQHSPPARIDSSQKAFFFFFFLLLDFPYFVFLSA